MSRLKLMVKECASNNVCDNLHDLRIHKPRGLNQSHDFHPTLLSWYDKAATGIN